MGRTPTMASSGSNPYRIFRSLSPSSIRLAAKTMGVGPCSPFHDPSFAKSTAIFLPQAHWWTNRGSYRSEFSNAPSHNPADFLICLVHRRHSFLDPTIDVRMEVQLSPIQSWNLVGTRSSIGAIRWWVFRSLHSLRNTTRQLPGQ